MASAPWTTYETADPRADFASAREAMEADFLDFRPHCHRCGSRYGRDKAVHIPGVDGFAFCTERCRRSFALIVRGEVRLHPDEAYGWRKKVADFADEGDAA